MSGGAWEWSGFLRGLAEGSTLSQAGLSSLSGSSFSGIAWQGLEENWRELPAGSANQRPQIRERFMEVTGEPACFGPVVC